MDDKHAPVTGAVAAMNRIHRIVNDSEEDVQAVTNWAHVLVEALDTRLGLSKEACEGLQAAAYQLVDIGRSLREQFNAIHAAASPPEEPEGRSQPPLAIVPEMPDEPA